MAIKKITVSELICACLDQEWRQRWLKGEKPSTRIFPPSGTPTVFGTLFHLIVEDYVGWLTLARNKRIAGRLECAGDIWNEMYGRFAGEKLAALLEDGKIDPAYHLGQALKSFCGRMEDLRRRTPYFQSWRDLYLVREFSVKNVRFDVSDRAIKVSGKLDAVRTHPESGLEIVDYKLSHGSRMKHDLLQLAIYAELMSFAKPELDFQGTLEYYEPELHETTVSPDDLRTVFEEIVWPILHELAGETSVSSRKARTVTTGKSAVNIGKARLSDSINSVEKSEAKDLSAEIEQCYASFKLHVQIVDKQEAPQLVRYKLKPGAGVKVVSLVNRSEDLQVALSLNSAPLIEPAQGYVTVDIPKELPDTVLWQDVVENPLYAAHQSPVSFPVGVGVDNRVVVADLSDANTCHALVAGTSGSGKSEFLKCLVASLIRKNTPKSLKLTIIDPKVLTFGSFSNSSYLTSPIITDVGSTIPCLQKAVAEMNERYGQLGEEGFENLGQHFAAGQKEIPFHIIVIDEFADLILAGKNEKKEFENLVSRLAAKGRAAGIHLVLSTQRPDKNIVTGLIKSNLPLKICLRVLSATNSKIVLDQSGGESLLGKGDLLYDLGKTIQRAQSPFIP
ncbi:MAG: cell division protein FtsK [Proteobacteria bacterium]|nr:cell division protein FtsK [Pseudomonadota bacterium]